MKLTIGIVPQQSGKLKERILVERVTNLQPFVLQHVSVHRLRGQEPVPVLQHMNMTIHPGEWVSIVGRNGSGKSTLAQLLSGVLVADEGTVDRGFVGPMPIPYVMQHKEQLFGETPWEDLVFLLEARGEDPDAIPHLALSSLRQLGLEPIMHQPIRELSGGQRQLVATAGCLAARAPLLLFDEATSMLDSGSRLQVLKAVQSVHQAGTTVVWLTHHMEEVGLGDRVIALQEGKKIFDGTTQSFFYGKSFVESKTDVSKVDAQSPCEAIGFEPPFAVQVARQLLHTGASMTRPLPVTAEQLAKAVARHG